MARFEIDKIYEGKTFTGYPIRFKCIGRTSKTVKLQDVTYNDDEPIEVKRIKSNSKGEYVVFSAEYMGFCEMELRA